MRGSSAGARRPNCQASVMWVEAMRRIQPRMKSCSSRASGSRLADFVADSFVIRFFFDQVVRRVEDAAFMVGVTFKSSRIAAFCVQGL